MSQPIPLLRLLTPEAAGSLSATAEAPTPHEKLREAAPPDAMLIAQDRSPAQLAQGYRHHSLEAERMSRLFSQALMAKYSARREALHGIPK